MKYTQAILLLFLILGVAYAGDNILTNPDFTQNDCHSDRCRYSPNTYLADCIEGWIPENDIQLGHGSNYCDYFPTEDVVVLPPQQNSCVKQFIPNVKAGGYQFDFTYGAQKGKPFSDCRVEPFFNGKSLGVFRPQSHDVHTQQIKFTVEQDCEYAQIKVCGGNGAASAWIRVMQLIKQERGSLTFEPSPLVTYDQIRNMVAPKPIQVVTQYIAPIIVIDSHGTQCFRRQFNLQAGWNQLTFNYRTVFAGYVFNSNVVVKFNGQVIGTIYPKDCEFHDFVFDVFIKTAGKYTLEFCPAGCVGQVFHKIIIKDCGFVLKPCLGKQFQNLVVNGDFETTACPSNTAWCLWSNTNIPANGVSGWIPSPQIQIGFGTVYSSKLSSTSRVLQLDPNRNTCVIQRLALKAGRYVLRFDRAARQGVSKQSNAFNVSINTQLLFDIIPQNYEVIQETKNFLLNYPPAVSELKFCGKGDSDSLGALIDNVKLFYLDECKNVQAPGLPFPSVPTPPPLPNLPYMPAMPGYPTMPTMPSGW